MDELNVQSLLSRVTEINKKYEEIAKITGENFNIFSILGMESSEVRTHSAFLAELLSPKGSHGQGAIFLKHFIGVINQSLGGDKNISFDFDESSIDVFVEKLIGPKTKDSGGRIDILISKKEKPVVIIENKIYARLQENQLRRYYNYGKEFKGKFWLIYLKLSKKDSDLDNFGNDEEVKQNTILITYEETIIKWLELCKKESTDLSILRETITQYIYLVKTLTGQSKNKNMEKEIINILLERKNIDAAKAIRSAMVSLEKQVNNRTEEVCNKVKVELEAKQQEFIYVDSSEKPFTIWFNPDNHEKLCAYMNEDENYTWCMEAYDLSNDIFKETIENVMKVEVDDKKYSRDTPIEDIAYSIEKVITYFIENIPKDDMPLDDTKKS